ncbi:M20 family metallopeptidase [Pseudonocardia sp. MH-G8]|uniref:M20 family metallopeptidase n=1 Tax=Pseudonocardia sp. MH-G8 TaxID=1854588 RepID=UPI0018E93D66|nr:M20 family metallopeptidase [Pseudonocardia sp. MH-G8]
MLADLEQLVTCESPSADRAAVAASAEVVARQGAAALGVAGERLVVDGSTHLRWRFGAGRRRALVLGHHDTVWPLGSLATHPWSLRDGIATGPGCFDMKAGVVQAFHALAALRADGHDLDGVTVLVTGDEEIGSPSSEALIRQEARGCDAAFVLEASADGGALKTGRKGASIYEIEVHGRAAHAGLEPEKGVNAGIELAHQVLAIAALADPAQATTVTPSVLRAGTTTNTVPASAGLAVDVRVLSVAEQDRVDRAVRALRTTVAGARTTVSGGPNRPPLSPDSSAALFSLAREVAGRLGLPPLEGVTVGGASDGNFTAGEGVPTLDGLGAVGGGAHADDEHVRVAEMPGRTALLAGLLATVLEGGGRG